MLPPALSRSFTGLLRSSASKSSPLAAPAAAAVGIHAQTQTRAFASVLPDKVAAKDKAVATSALPPTPEGHLRPHYGIEVNPNHGLYAFFRKVEKDGEVSYLTIETQTNAQAAASRSWLASELRRKSFKDLHTLWYVLLRERNLLTTQKHETGRVRGNPQITAPYLQIHKVRKSMARIKYVINERRLAYENALKILQKRRADQLAEIERKRREEERAAAKAEAKRLLELAEKQKAEEEKLRIIEDNTPKPRGKETKPEQFVLAGLFDTGLSSVTQQSSKSKRP